MKTLVLMNQQHDLFPIQKELLNQKFPGWKPVFIPASGWSLEQQIHFCKEELVGVGSVVFVSPVPYILARLSFLSGQGRPLAVYVFVNDKRVKKELPNGKIIQTVASDGWKLIII